MVSAVRDKVEAEVEALVTETLVPLLRVHGGGVELVGVRGGTARLRFTDACVACRLRPLTTAAAIRPRVLEIDGVDEVEIEGVRVSDAALRRFERYGANHYARLERKRDNRKKARNQ